MMGTVWLRLDANQESIQPFINALFFAGAFMSFMAVAYVPAYLEDYDVFRKDRANGLYGPSQFMLANFLIGVPYLCMPCCIFQAIKTDKALVIHSCDHDVIRRRQLLAYRVPIHRTSILQTRHVALPRSPGRRIACGTPVIYSANLCRGPGDGGVRQWSLDVGRRFPRTATSAQRVLQVCFPLHRLPSVRLPGYDGQRIPRPHL